MNIRFLMAGAIAFGAVFSQAAHAVAINNGSFETGDFTGWSTGGSFVQTFVTAASYGSISGAKDGSYWAALGSEMADGTLSQTITDTAGVSYTLTWWLASDGNTPNDFSVAFGGSSVFSAVDMAAKGWTAYSATVSGTGSDLLEFSFRNDYGYFSLDNISLTASVPDGGPGLLLTTGILLGVCGAGYAFRGHKTGA